MKSIKINELIDGQYYYMIGDGKWTEIQKSAGGTAYYYTIKPDREKFNKSEGRWRTDISWVARLATYDEIEWLELCNKENKFVPKPIYHEYY